MKFTKDREGDKICLILKQCLKKVLRCFDISEKSKHVSTSLAHHMKLSALCLLVQMRNENVCLKFHMLILLVV